MFAVAWTVAVQVQQNTLIYIARCAGINLWKFDRANTECGYVWFSLAKTITPIVEIY